MRFGGNRQPAAASLDLSVDTAVTVAPMSRWRVFVASAVIIVLLLGHLTDIAFQREHWPFSWYPMYSDVQTKTQLGGVVLYALYKKDGKPTWARVSDSSPVTMLPALRATQMRIVLKNAWRRGNHESDWRQKQLNNERTTRIMLDYLRMYEAKRISRGSTGGPQVLELRLYEVAWYLDPKKDSLDEPNRRVYTKKRVTLKQALASSPSATPPSPTTAKTKSP